MRVSVEEIKSVPGKSIRLDLSEDFQSEELGFRLTAPVVFQGSAENKGKYILLEGNISTKAELECASCLKHFEYEIKADFYEGYALEIIDSDEELDIHSFTGSEIEIDSEICSAVLFSLPMRVLCREDCKGRCPYCGIDLNTDSCNCREEQIDPRLAVLKKFKFDSSDKEV